MAATSPQEYLPALAKFFMLMSSSLVLWARLKQRRPVTKLRRRDIAFGVVAALVFLSLIGVVLVLNRQAS